VAALATRGVVAATAAPATLTITAGSNDQLNVTVNGTSASVTLAAGTYTSASLAAALQSSINGAPELVKAGLSVGVSADAGGVLSITSQTWGSSSTIGVGGTAATDLMPGATMTTGTDVAGTINGVSATGSGQFLTGSDGLKLQVTGGAAPADRGSVAFARGFGDLVSNLIDNFIGTDGIIPARTTNIQSSIKTIGTQRNALNVKLAATQKRYQAQFTALDVTISQMNTTSNYLTQQLAALKANSG
jgi:flagellar hook-associated protein 2